MFNLVTIDPALACTGWAYFKGPRLAECGIVRTKPEWPLAKRIGHAAEILARYDQAVAWASYDLLIEWPQIYTYGKSKGDPNDLLPVAGVAAACATWLSYDSRPARLVRPAEWKKQVPKDVHNARVLAGLEPDEIAVLEGSGIPRSLRHNAIDAIGLGLWSLGRMERRNVASVEAETLAGLSGANPAGLVAANSDQEAPALPRRGRRRSRAG